MGFAAVARVTGERWVACEVLDKIGFGLKSGGELQLDSTLAHEVRQSREAVVIEHHSEQVGEQVSEQVFGGDAERPRPTPVNYKFQSFISVPIILSNGEFFGILCAIDLKPIRLNKPETMGMFKLFAELVTFHLNAQEQRASSALQLQEERREAELREEFIAVIGHDLRNPLGALSSGSEFLKLTPLDEMATRVVDAMQRSVARMSSLINDVLDFARGRLGSGLDVLRRDDQPIESTLNQVITDLGASWPGRAIEARYLLVEPVKCDASRIAQLFANILGNALTYGAPDQPIRVQATSQGGTFELSVANAGEPISPTAQERLFQPFFRGEEQPKQQGLGLGLYIAAEIARAHDGTLVVTSTSEETRFTLRIPNR